MRSLVLAVASALLITACSGSAGSMTSNTAAPNTADSGTAAPDSSDLIGTDSIDASADSTAPDSTDDSATAEVVTTPAPAADKDIITRSADAVGDGVPPQGFTTVTALVTSAEGEVCEVCLWLADEPDESGRGLMGVTDLGGPVGMAFVYDAPRDGAFFMFGTPTPLSIAWFSPSGEHVAQADMDPCVVEDSSVCERYRPDATYDVAIEMFTGQLSKVGIGPGSSIELLDLPCN